MRNRTKLFVSALIAGSALAAAVPASAQDNNQQYRGSGYDQRYDRNGDGRYDNRDSYDRNGDGRYDNRDSYDRNNDGRYDNRDTYNRYDRGDYRGNANAIWTQIQQLQFRVNRNDNRDRISEREAAGLRRAVSDLRYQFRDYNRDGLTQRETRYLQDRINQIRSHLQYERHDNDGRRW